MVLRGSKTRWVAPPPSTSTGNLLFECHVECRRGIKGTTPPVPVAGRDMSLLISFLQTIGLPQEVMSQVESKLAPPRQKEITDEKALALVKAKLAGVVAQKNKLNRTVLYHTAKLRESEELLAAKLAELAEVENEYRAASSKRFSPTQSVAASAEPHSDPEPGSDGMSQDGAPAQGVVGETTAPDPEKQVRIDVADGKKRCGSALPATTNLAGRPLSAPSVELFESGIGVYSGVEIARLKSIVDSRIQATQDAADTDAHWAQVQEMDDERELMRSTPLG